MCAGSDEQSVLRRNKRPVPEPMRCRILVRLHAAKALIAHQINQIAAERFEAVLHAIKKLRVVGLGRKIHRQIDDLGVTRDRTVPALGRRAHERPLPDPGFDQAASLCLDIAARHGRKVDIEAAR
jgi:hypothetical protein